MNIQRLQQVDAKLLITQFKESYPHGYYYLESIEHMTLQPIAKLDPAVTFQVLRLFHPDAQLLMRRNGNRIDAVFMEASNNGLPLTKKEERFIVLEKNEQQQERILTVAIYEHAQYGLFEQWKEVKVDEYAH